MLDIKLIRNNPELIKENIKKKFEIDKLSLVDEFLDLDKELRSIQKAIDDLRKERNLISEQINESKKSGKNIDQLLKKVKDLPEEIKHLEEKERPINEKIQKILLELPNIIHHSVPIGKDSSDNIVREIIGTPKEKEFSVINHAKIAESLSCADFETAVKTSGKGFYYLKGDLALLNMALINFSRDHMISKGYEYVEPPLLIREQVLNAVYSSKDIAEQVYKIENEDLYLIATSEHPLIGLFIGKTLRKKDLPIKITGYSVCFRKEIGSHGIDEKGLFRTHQFHKQEMIVICNPEDSYKYYDEMMNYSKEIFTKLELPFREIECCSGDLSVLKTKSGDLEVWSPRKKEYYEVTSCTNMEEAQSRRLNLRVEGEGKIIYPHTLNNTVIATSRAMVAILENYQTKEGTVLIPTVLQPYMGGKTEISPTKPAKNNNTNSQL